MATKKLILKMFNGEEFWTNAFIDRFGERVCIMIEDEMVWHQGKKFKPTTKEVKGLYNEYWHEGDGKYLVEEMKKEFI